VSISGAEATVIAGLVGGGSAVIAATLATIGTYAVTDRSVKEVKSEGDRQRTADEAERRLDRQHAWDLAAEDRQQLRRRDAYVTLQIYATGWSNYARWRIRNFETSPPTPAPELPQLEPHTIATAELLASQSVADAVAEFTNKLMLFRVAIGSYEEAQRMADPELPGSVAEARTFLNHMEQAGRRVVEAEEELRRMMRGELAGTASPR
jgi:hypothetical protein